MNDEENVLLKQRRPCSILNSEMTEVEPAWFHMWFIPEGEGWPKALIELGNGRMISVSYRKVIFDRDYVLNDEISQ